MSIVTVQRDSPAQKNAIWGRRGERGRRGARRDTNRGWKARKHSGLSQGEEENKLLQGSERAQGMVWGERAHPRATGFSATASASRPWLSSSGKATVQGVFLSLFQDRI